MQEEIHKELWNRDEREIYPIKEGIEVNGQKIPDPKKHQIISFTKSGIRILGYIFLPFSLEIATILLILSEVVGIIEELV
jgi:hypothetical protein